ncbi:MAG: AMMECR1 domain-containing protein [Vampirovibrionales bacterium]|nr:AMMECR1 domain-containing protein [Vampirovibrionales bacterium]
MVLSCLGIGFTIENAWAKTKTLRLPQIAGKTIEAYFENPPASYAAFAAKFPVAQDYRRQAGLFVTLSQNGKSRACWGALTPSQGDLVKQTVFATIDTLTKDYRYAPIRKSEWRELKPQVSIVEGIEPIRSYRQLNPLRDGLLLRSGAKSGVILPREARDAYYQWVMARKKAGVSIHDPQQLYRLRIIIEE